MAYLTMVCRKNELSPDEDDLSNWGVDGKHLPDNSQLRSHTVEDAVQCLTTSKVFHPPHTMR